MPRKHAEPKPVIVVEAVEKKRFEHYRWREAILYFLQQVWSGYGETSSKATVDLSFYLHSTDRHGAQAKVHLRYDPRRDVYVAFGCLGEILEFDLITSGVHVLRPYVCDAAHFERALARFARNRNYQALVLPLVDKRHIDTLVFWQRGELLDLGLFRDRDAD